MCPVSGSVVLHSTIALAVGLTDIAAKDTSVDMIHRKAPPTDPAVVVVGQVLQAREMLEAVVEEAMVARAELVATPITIPMEVPPAVPHRAVLPLAPLVRRNYSLAVVADPVKVTTSCSSRCSNRSPVLPMISCRLPSGRAPDSCIRRTASSVT